MLLFFFLFLKQQQQQQFIFFHFISSPDSDLFSNVIPTCTYLPPQLNFHKAWDLHLPCLPAHACGRMRSGVCIDTSFLLLTFPIVHCSVSKRLLPRCEQTCIWVNTWTAAAEGSKGDAVQPAWRRAAQRSGGRGNKSSADVDVGSGDAENNYRLSLAVSEVKEIHGVVGNGMQTTECIWRWGGVGVAAPVGLAAII